MSKRQGVRRQTFAEIVATTEAPPPVQEKTGPIRPGHFNGDALYDPEGRALRHVDDRLLKPHEVRSIVLAGARLVWDSCGCGGYCNILEWPDQVALLRQAKATAPRFRKHYPLSTELLTGAGGDVLLVSGGLQWGTLIR